MADDVSPKARSKRYHQRSTWACDECKLRKKKCDGNKPCAKCTLYGKVCTYELQTRPSVPLTQRIRSLEESIRSVRELLTNIRPELSGQSLADVDRMLADLKPGSGGAPQPVVSPPTDASNTTSSSDELTLTSMLVGRGRLLYAGSKPFFHGPYSGTALICSILEFFDSAKPEAIHPLVIELFDQATVTSLESMIRTETEFKDLPGSQDAMSLVNSVLTQRHPFLQFLDSTTLWQTVETAYSQANNTVNASELSFCHALFALAYLGDVSYHRERGCDWALLEASIHFRIARSMLESSPMKDILALQAMVCITVYLVWTSQLSDAYTFISIVATSAIKQGLHMTAEVITGSSKSVKSTQKDLLTALVNIDLYVSTVLGLPPLVNIDTAGTTLSSGQNSSQHASQSFFGEQMSRMSKPSTSGDLSVKYSQIISLTASVLWNLSALSSGQGERRSSSAGLEATILAQAEKDLAIWTTGLGIVLSPSASTNEDVSPKTSIAKIELELNFYWSQLLIYSPFLHYLRPLAEGQSVSESLSRPALRCLKVAVNTIIRCDNALQSQNADGDVAMIRSSNWNSIYTVFLAVLTLIFLISAHEGTSKPSEAWRKAQTGIKILAALRCGEGGASRCLAIIKELVRQLNYTVDFDIDQIEKTTPRVCEKHQSFHGADTWGMAAAASTQMDLSSIPTHSGLGVGIASGSANYPTPTSFSADEMLAKANDLPLMSDLMELEDMRQHFG